MGRAGFRARVFGEREVRAGRAGAVAVLLVLAAAGCSQSGPGPAPGSAPLLPAEQPGVFLSPPAVAPQTDPPACNEPQVRITSPQETNADYSKRMINAQVAYDLGLTGRCVSVGVLDNGLTTVPHPDLPRERIAVYPTSYYEDSLAITRLVPNGERVPLAVPGHGTSIAGIIAATADGAGMHGVAPGAKVRMWTLRFSGGGGGFNPPSIQALANSDADLQRRFKNVMNGVDILNMSWVWSDSPVDYEPTRGRPLYTATELRRALPLSLAQFIQAGTDEDDRIIFVWSSGNYPSQTSPYLPGGLVARIPQLRGHWLTVTAVDESGARASFATPCGIASDNCLAAPGNCILAPVAYAPEGHSYQVPASSYTSNSRSCQYYSPHSPLYHRPDGTSFAAPIVAGALALVIERFRGQLGNTAVTQRVLATANRQGRYSASATYGQGLLDVGAAVQPVGRSSLMLGSQSVALDGLRQGLIDASGLLSLLSSGLRGLEIMVRDELGAPFWHHFAQLPGAAAHPFDARWSQLLPLAIDKPFGRTRWQQRLVQHSSLTASTSPTPGYALDSRGSSGFSGRALDSRGGSSSGLVPSSGDGSASVQGLGGRAASSDYALSGGSSDSSGVFVGVGVHPGWLMGAYAGDGLRIGDFGGHRAFVAPALQQVAAEAVGGGVTLDLGGVSWSAALFRGRSVGDVDASGEENSLLMAEYRRDGSRGFWLLQAGVVQEPGSWLGVHSEGSVYGGFGARTGYLNLMGLWAPGSSWQLLGSWYRSGTELQPLAAGLLVSVEQVQGDQLELGVLKRSVLRPGDALGLRWVGSVQRAEGVSWHLPIGLYRRQVQYADPVQNLKSDLQQRAEAVYGLPLGRSSKLWLRFGRDRGPAADDYAALSLTLDL